MKLHQVKRPFSLLTAAVLLLTSLSLSTLPKTAGAETEAVSFDYEDGTLQGWGGRGGNEVLAVNGTAAHSGSYGLSVTGRTQGWNGPIVNLPGVMEVGKTYAITAWVRLPAGLPASTVSVLIQRQSGGESFYEHVNGKTASDSGWVQLSGQYTLKQPAESLGLYLESFDNPTLDFYVDDVRIERIPDPEPIVIQHDIPNLKDLYADQFLLGAALLVGEIEDPDSPDAQLVKKHFNSITAGNELKWDATEPTEGQFNFTRSDKIVNFAAANGIAARGHTLIWHSQTPNWVFYDENGNLASKELLYQRMKRHIDEVVGRYKGQIYAWDVVNEVIEVGDGQPGGLRNSLWYQIAGEEFIEKAFEYAHAADPDAKLYINDYNTNIPNKRQALYDLIKRLQAKGIPVHGVGHQTHIGIANPAVQELDDMLQAFRDLGIEQQVTELDMSVYTNDSQSYETFPEDLKIVQAYRYKEIFDVFEKHADQLTAVIFWGKDDLNTWLRTFPVDRNNWPLLFDERLQAKYAYWALVDPSKVPVMTKQTEASEGCICIDGQLDDAWSWAKPIQVQSEGRTVATIKTLWEPGRLNVLADVFDTTVNGNDAVEIFIDADNGKTDSLGADDRKYALRRSGANPHKTAEYTSVKIDGGYRIEAAISSDSVALGSTIGFEVRVADRSGSVLAVTSWNDASNAQASNPSRWGELTFVEGPRMATAAVGTPVVDGETDDIWNSAEVIQTDRWVQGTSGATASVRTLWDAGRLYVLAEVTDAALTKRSANVWEQDSVEIFVDQNHARTANYDADDGQYRINFDNEPSVSPGSLSGNLVSAAKRTENGYVVEASIAWTGGAPEAGAVIGFDVQVNDDANDDGVRDSVAIWNDVSGLSWSNLTVIGVLQLGE